jgi:hypothetical protein
MGFKQRLQTAAGHEVKLHPEWRNRLAHGPLAASAGEGIRPGVGNVADFVGVRDRLRRAGDDRPVVQNEGVLFGQGLHLDQAAEGIAFKSHRKQFGVVLEVDDASGNQTACITDAQVEEFSLLGEPDENVAGVVGVSSKNTECVFSHVGRRFLLRRSEWEEREDQEKEGEKARPKQMERRVGEHQGIVAFQNGWSAYTLLLVFILML